MTETLTAEQLSELETLAKCVDLDQYNLRICGAYHIALNEAAPALIAMAKALLKHESPAWDANERLNDAIEEQIARAEKAEAERDKYRYMAVRLAKMTEGRLSLKDSDQFAKDIAALLSEDPRHE